MGGFERGNKIIKVTHINQKKEFTNDDYYSELMIHNYLDILNSCEFNEDERMIKALDISDLELTKAILTGYIRQEQFCDVIWAEAIEK